jgi:CIC family chloride channel protein
VQWGAIGLPPALVEPGGSAFAPHLGAGLLLVLAVLKTLATGLTISSGGSGGVFGPSVFIGGMLGGAVGQLLALAVPAWRIDPAAFTLVGMGGFFAGVSKTPLTSIVMVCEMAGSYSLLVPLMLVCGLNLGLSQRWTIYEEQVPTPVDSPAHQGDFVVDVLERIRVEQVPIRTETIERVPEATPFDQVLRLVADSAETLFPVVDRAGRLTGIFTLRDVRLALVGADWGPLVLATDLATRPVLTVTPRDDLHTALRRLTELNVDEIPVVDPDDPARLIGLLDRRQVVATYTAQIAALRAPVATSGAPAP